MGLDKGRVSFQQGQWPLRPPGEQKRVHVPTPVKSRRPLWVHSELIQPQAVAELT